MLLTDAPQTCNVQTPCKVPSASHPPAIRVMSPVWREEELISAIFMCDDVTLSRG